MIELNLFLTLQIKEIRGHLINLLHNRNKVVKSLDNIQSEIIMHYNGFFINILKLKIDTTNNDFNYTTSK